jgi:hypothetical protein
VTQLLGQGRAEGWHKDPFSRHQLRFFDGQRWTPYVRDDGENGMDDPADQLPAGIIAELATSRSALLEERVFVVERHTDLYRRWSDRAVYHPDGSPVAVLRRAALTPDSPHPGLLPVHLDPTTYDVAELLDASDSLVLTLIRPLGGSKTSVSLCDSTGEEAGRIVEQSRVGRESTFALLAPNGGFLGDLQADSWVVLDLRIVDSHDRVVATINRDFTGLDRSRFSRPDGYVVRLTEAVHGPLRTLVIACALSLEVMVRPRDAG